MVSKGLEAGSQRPTPKRAPRKRRPSRRAIPGIGGVKDQCRSSRHGILIVGMAILVKADGFTANPRWDAHFEGGRYRVMRDAQRRRFDPEEKHPSGEEGTTCWHWMNNSPTNVKPN